MSQEIDFPVFRTSKGVLCVADSRQVLPLVESESVDLILTSPPFPIPTKKVAKGGKYVQPFKSSDDFYPWLETFVEEFKRVLKPSGSLLIETATTWVPGLPVVDPWQWRMPEFFSSHGFYFIQELWILFENRLAVPVEWVGKQKIRFRWLVNPLWWFSKTPFPKVKVGKVRTAKSDSRDKIPDRVLKRDSGHTIRPALYTRIGQGRIRGNVFRRGNTADRKWVRLLRAMGRNIHPARFPEPLVKDLIRTFTDPGDLVLDPWAGSNTVGYVAEQMGRRWVSAEIDPAIAADSILRFLPPESLSKIIATREEKS